MEKYFFAAAFLILSVVLSDVNAQTSTDAVLSMEVYSIAVTRDSTEEKNPTDSTIFSVFIHLSLVDTLNIDELIVKLGDKGIAGSRFQHVFKWDVFGAAGKGTNYSRNGYNVILSLGNFICFLNYEASVVVKRLDGTSVELERYSR